MVIISGEAVLDFNDLKEQYKRRMEIIQKEKKTLASELSELVNQMEKIMAEMRKLATAYPNFPTLHEWSEANWIEFNDFLKTSGFNSLNDFDTRWNELTGKDEELAKSYRNTMNRFKQLEVEEKEEFIWCPKCNGVGYTTDKEFVESDTGRQMICHPKLCTLCNSRGKIPTKELVDC